MKYLILLALVPSLADASVKVFNKSNAQVGIFSDVKTGYGLQATKVSGKAYLSTVGGVQEQSSTSGDLAVADCGKTLISDGEDTWRLPDISADSALGCRFTFVVGATSTAVGLKIRPKTEGEQILIMTNNYGDDVSADLQGESVTLEAVKNDGVHAFWAPVAGVNGTWVDLN